MPFHLIYTSLGCRRKTRVPEENPHTRGEHANSTQTPAGNQFFPHQPEYKTTLNETRLFEDLLHSDYGQQNRITDVKLAKIYPMIKRKRKLSFKGHYKDFLWLYSEGRSHHRIFRKGLIWSDLTFYKTTLADIVRTNFKTGGRKEQDVSRNISEKPITVKDCG